MEQNKKKTQKKRTFTAYITSLAVLSFLLVFTLNLLATRLDIVWDMTPTGMYQLTDTSKKMLEELDKQVNFYFLLDMDLLSTDTNSMALYHALDEYRSYDKINFIDFEPDEDPERTEQLQNYGYQLSRGDIVVECEGRTKHISGKNMYQSTLEENSNVIESMYFAGENYISGAIDAVVSGRDTVIYFLTGHGEKSLRDSYTMLAKNLSNRNYLTQELDLMTADNVPADAAMVIVAGPKTDISKNELRILDAYLNDGGNICFWMSPNQDEVKYTNIESILESFGLRMDYDLVAEKDSSLHISGDEYTFRCSVVAQTDSNKTDLTSGIAEYINNGIIPFMSRTRSFYQILTPTDTTLEIGSLLQTVQNGTNELGTPKSSAVGEPYGGTDVTNQKVTDQVLDLAMYAKSESRSDAKVMVMGNAEFIDDENVKQDYMIVPVNMMLSVFSWMYDSDQSIDLGIANKERTYDSMRMNSEKAANTTNIIFVVVPIAVGLIGLGVWLKRRYS